LLTVALGADASASGGAGLPTGLSAVAPLGAEAEASLGGAEAGATGWPTMLALGGAEVDPTGALGARGLLTVALGADASASGGAGLPTGLSAVAPLGAEAETPLGGAEAGAVCGAGVRYACVIQITVAQITMPKMIASVANPRKRFSRRNREVTLRRP
jgi:hypothetical protein